MRGGLAFQRPLAPRRGSRARTEAIYFRPPFYTGAAAAGAGGGAAGGGRGGGLLRGGGWCVTPRPRPPAGQGAARPGWAPAASPCRPAAAAEGSSAMEQPVTLVIKAPNQKYTDQTVRCFLHWTVARLKSHLAAVYPSQPVSGRGGGAVLGRGHRPADGAYIAWLTGEWHHKSSGGHY